MERKHWVFITGFLSMLLAFWIVSGMNSAYDRQTDQIHDVLDDVEKEMGTYDPNSRKEAMPARAMRVAREQKLRVEEKQREIEEILLAEREALGDPYAKTDSSASDSGSTEPERYFDEYGRPIH